MTFRKLLINYDSNPKKVDDIKTNIQTYELMPFDGMVAGMTLADPVLGDVTSYNNVWTGSSWDWSMAQTPISDIITTKYQKFQHNFLYAKCSPVVAFGQPPVDWFDPAFPAVINNFAFLAAIAFSSEGRYKGVWFDPEPTNSTTGWKLFNYSDRPQTATYTFEEYQAQAKLCGQRIMEAMQRSYPGLKFLINFGYEQAIKQSNPPIGTNNYGLLAPFFDGLFDAASGETEIHNMYEDGYGHYTAAQWAEDTDVVRNPPETVFDSPRYYGSVKKGNLIWVDYIDGDFPSFSTVNNLLNYFTAARFQQALIDMFTYEDVNGQAVDTYAGVYSQSVNWLTTSPTIPQVYINAANAARASLDWQEAFNPLLLENVVGYFNPFTMGLANNAPIASYVDPAGATWIQASGPAQPLFQTAGINSLPSVLFAAASSQFLTSDALAANYTGTDKPMTVIALVFVSAAGTAYTYVNCGGSGANNPCIDIRASVGSKWVILRTDSAASSATATSTANVTAAATIVTYVTDGTNATIRVNGVRDTTDAAQDVGLMTLNQFTIGARRTGANTQFFDGNLGPIIIASGAMGLSQIQYCERGIALQYGITLAGG